MDICKIIIPAAGLATRFLPYTKTIPKALLPLLNKPAIQYIIEEGLQAALDQFIIIAGQGQPAIASYFQSKTYQNISTHTQDYAELEKIIKHSTFMYLQQSEPLGLGHAVLLARSIIGKEHVAICLPDDIIINRTGALLQLLRVARQEKASVIAVQEVPRECVSSYGIISVKKQITPSLFQVADVIEKPHQNQAPSNLAIIGRYVLSPKIFTALAQISTDYASDELQLSDGISCMIKNNEKVFAYKVQGTRYDIGIPLGWVKALIGIALQDPVYGPHVQKFLQNHDTLDSFIYNHDKIINHQLIS